MIYLWTPFTSDNHSTFFTIISNLLENGIRKIAGSPSSLLWQSKALSISFVIFEVVIFMLWEMVSLPLMLTWSLMYYMQNFSTFIFIFYFNQTLCALNIWEYEPNLLTLHICQIWFKVLVSQPKLKSIPKDHEYDQL